MKLTIKQVENKLKAAHRAEERRKAKSRKIHGRTSWNESNDDWTKVWSLNWQRRNEQFKGCNGKAVFDPIAMHATSYDWWVFVKRIKGKVVFNAHRYSVTTGGHQGSVRSILESLGVKIDLEVETRASLDAFETNALPALYQRLFELEIASKRRNAKDRSKEIKQVKRDIAMARSIGAKCSRADMREIKERCLAAEQARLSDLAEKRARERELNRAHAAMIKNNAVADLSSLAA